MPRPELTRAEIKEVIETIEWAMQFAPRGTVQVIYQDCRILDVIPAPRRRVKKKDKTMKDTN